MDLQAVEDEGVNGDIHEDFEVSLPKAKPYRIDQRQPSNIGLYKMDDIIGHDEAKSELNEHLVLPILHRRCTKRWVSTAMAVSFAWPSWYGKNHTRKGSGNLSEVNLWL